MDVLSFIVGVVVGTLSFFLLGALLLLKRKLEEEQADD